MITTQGKRGRPRLADPLDRRSGRLVYDALLPDRYPHATGDQLTKLLYSEKSRSLVMQRLFELRETGRIYSNNFIPKETPTPGNHTLIWSRNPEKKNPAFWGHPMLVNDIGINVERFVSETDVAELLAHTHDQDLKRQPVPVELPGGRHGWSVSDRFSALRINGIVAGFLFEADRGTESKNDPGQSTNIQMKLERLVAVARGTYEEHFGVPRIRIPWVIQSVKKSNESRLRELLEWTEELTVADAELVDEVFRFTTVDPAKTTPYEFMTGDHWVKPFSRSHVRLVTL